jgi:RNA polymerase sigma-70 factor (ECF subfamily)
MDADSDRSPPSAGAADLEGLRRGDEVAFVTIVERYQRPLLRLAQLYGSSEAVAEELVQDTWIAVLQGIDRFEGRSSLRTWIFRIMANKAKTRGARERRSLPISALLDPRGGPDDPAVEPSRFRSAHDARAPGHWLEPPADWGSDAEARLLEGETQAVIAAALDGLPAAQRLVMTLRDVEGWPSVEVSAALKISPGNQRVLLHRARSKVRAALERYFAEAAGA